MWIGDTLAAVPQVINLVPRTGAVIKYFAPPSPVWSVAGPARQLPVDLVRPAGRPASQSSSSSSQRYVTGALHLRGPNGKNSASLSLAAGHHRRPASRAGRPAVKKPGKVLPRCMASASLCVRARSDAAAPSPSPRHRPQLAGGGAVFYLRCA